MRWSVMKIDMHVSKIQAVCPVHSVYVVQPQEMLNHKEASKACKLSSAPAVISTSQYRSFFNQVKW